MSHSDGVEFASGITDVTLVHWRWHCLLMIVIGLGGRPVVFPRLALLLLLFSWPVVIPLTFK